MSYYYRDNRPDCERCEEEQYFKPHSKTECITNLKNRVMKIQSILGLPEDIENYDNKTAKYDQGSINNKLENIQNKIEAIDEHIEYINSQIESIRNDG